MFRCGPLYLANYESTADVVVNQGGSSSGKTYSILQALISIAVSNKGLVITTAGQDMPNLKVGAIRDMETIIGSSDECKALLKSYNRSDRIFEWKSGSIIEFKSYDNAQDAKSGKRDFLFLNEANGIPFDVWTELHMRTRVRSFIDYNPNAEFWVHEHLLGKPDVQFIRSWHEHNPFLSDAIRKKIEGLKEVDEDLWKVYARGLTGKIQGLIFRNYTVVDSVPETARFIANGIDFGYTNDPTALVRVYKQNENDLYVDLLIYETGMTNPDISKRIKELSATGENIADSAEPKSIKELQNDGLYVNPAQKGNDSVQTSIDILKRYNIYVTKRSQPLIKELNSYKWKEDKISGKPGREPVDFMNHAIDALRYVALNKLGVNKSGQYFIS